jgi:hypothetical protein
MDATQIQRSASPVNQDADQPPLDGAASAKGGNHASGALPRLDLGASMTQVPGETAPQPATSGDAHGTEHKDSDAPPAAQYVIPFDRAPKSSPGEQIIFGAVYTHATPTAYQLVYTSAGGHFNSQGSGVTTRTIAGLSARNVDWFIDSGWNGSSAVTMKLELQKTDGTVVSTTSWTFGKKTTLPKTIAQAETEGERDNPAVYTYTVAGDVPTEKFTGSTILETFGAYRSNLAVADIKPAYTTTHGLDTDAKIAAHFFPGSSNHGTFTVDASNKIADQHSGMSGGPEAQAQLVTPKTVEKALDQAYESNPGTVLGRYTITRILKTDGSKKITKKKI